MHRRRLILRRFGVMTFGLGYFEEGVWVDHLAAPAAQADAEIAAIHALLGCCPDVSDGREEAMRIGVARSNGAARQPVAAGRPPATA